jgi:hypothetical protein
MKRTYLIIAILVAATYQQLNAQGCVAIKGIGGICNRPSEGGSWYLDINNRYFKSYKHFVGKEEQKQRERNLLKTASSSYKRLKRNQVMFHEMRNKVLTQLVDSSIPGYNVKLTVTKNGI